MGSTNLRPKPQRRRAFPEHGLQQIMRGKHRLRILWDLQYGPRRFGELRKALSLGTLGTKEIAPRVLGRELKSLANLGLVHRRAYSVVPPRVEYRLTTLGRTLLPILSKMVDWGTKHLARRNQVANGSGSMSAGLISVQPRNLLVRIENDGPNANRRQYESARTGY